MATIIEEIPIDISEEAQPEEVDPVTDEAPVEEEPTAPAPKKRGRPIGAKNRPKPKIVAAPKAAKPKRKAPPPPPSEDEEESGEEEPPTPIPMRRTRSSIPEEYEHAPPLDPRLVAAEMLQMLSQRNAGRTQAKRAKYASWFPNPPVY
jgi:hypothetical protein